MQVVPGEDSIGAVNVELVGVGGGMLLQESVGHALSFCDIYVVVE